MESKPYDVVLLGPTGYTGRFCAEHIVKHLPTTLKWALAGRSLQKIESIAQELKALNPDRADPDVLAVQLTREELHPLAQKTLVIINCVGPYHLYSTPVIEACASNGTHYVDATGETPWVREIIEKYHETAKANGAIIIPSVGIESAPADLLTWALVKRVREDLSSHTREVICAINEMTSSGASGGTLSTILSTFDTLTVSDLLKSASPFTLAASAPPSDIPAEPLLAKLSGVRSVRDMGTLTTSPSGLADITIVHRSSTLMPEFYGPRFYFRQFLRARNTLTGILFHYVFLLAVFLLILPPVRALARRYVYAPGSGPRIEDSVNDQVEYRAVATADQAGVAPKRVLGKLTYRGTMYAFTGMSLAEAAMVLIECEEKVRRVSRGGIVTTATLGQEFVDRWEKVGCFLETRVVD
ncbi:saccharopine dehydrogenase [Aspergillus heteromorphus CBS 117.55]|uniref:Saccharopine dehydrogenase n=1 Tax=Aspergillus heteromorphus CBS 117.55 TaxID=1448321 RepID=A0A317W6H4_9EURO|nr:saccharopine dehydrogenase [Aspergillus heteromorphus CBS 117.55]PWY79750.1 saccharopine dehydrogenase [Aspergillus heteromorphus CBS 117.55]